MEVMRTEVLKITTFRYYKSALQYLQVCGHLQSKISGKSNAKLQFEIDAGFTFSVNYLVKNGTPAGGT